MPRTVSVINLQGQFNESLAGRDGHLYITRLDGRNDSGSVCFLGALFGLLPY